jgi:hypothetical protein
MAKDWFLKEWMAFKKRRQAQIIRDIGWERGRVSKVVNSRQAYARDDVNTLAAWLEIEPFELLMPPAEALALRRLREAAHLIVAEEPAVYEHQKPGRPKS